MTITRPISVRWLLVAMVLVGAVATACKGGDDGGNRGNAEVSASPTPPPDPRQLLNTAADRLEKMDSFHYLLEHERGATPIVLSLQMTRAEGDVAKPDKLRADVDAQLRGVKVKVKLVSVGDKAKISNPFLPSQYQDLPTGTKLSDVFDPAAGTTAALRNVKDPKLVGEETFAGKAVWHVDGDVDAQSLSALASLAEPGHIVKGSALIDKQTGDILRVRLDGPLGKDDVQDVIRVLTISKFNETVNITPVP